MGLAAIYKKEGNTGSMFYTHTDHLGSINVITTSTGAVHEEMNFGPWGRRRNPYNWTYTNVPEPELTDRGYTMHEHLPEFGLINMNGRAYDPMLARFLNADPIIQAPGNMQNYNSYSYLLNNPLKYTDPSGYGWTYWDRSERLPVIDQILPDQIREDGWGYGTAGSMGYSYNDAGYYTDRATGAFVDWKTAVLGSIERFGGSIETASSFLVENFLDGLGYYTAYKGPHPYSEKGVIGLINPNNRTHSGWDAIINLDNILQPLMVYGTVNNNPGGDLFNTTEMFNQTIAETKIVFGKLGEMIDGLPYDAVTRYGIKMYVFAELVGNGKPYDLKEHGYHYTDIGYESWYNGNRVGYQDYGNYNFGVAANSLGLFLDDALFGAGMNELKKWVTGNDGNPNFLNTRGYFDSPKATNLIIRGYNGQFFP